MIEINLRDEIGQVLLKNGLNRRVCEVGVLEGVFFQKILESKPDLAVAVDAWEKCCKGLDPGALYTRESEEKLKKARLVFIQNFLPLSNVQIVDEFSEVAAAAFPDAFFDFIYLDASHDYASIKKDIRAWVTKVRSGGVIGGHDYCHAMVWGINFGVVRAVQEFVSERGWQNRLVITKENIHPSWFICLP